MVNRLGRAGSVVALILICLTLFFFRLGERSLRNPDEGRYAEIAREMTVSNDWLVPTLYGMDYLSKPILFYWFIAFSFKLLGFSEFAARFVPALFGLLGVLATYFFVDRYFGKEKAFFTSLILATNFFYLEISRYLLIDVVFAFFLLGVFYSAYLALENRRQTYLLLFYGFLALAILTKGLAGVAIPAFALLLYFIFSRKLRTGIVRLLSVKGILLFLAIVLPWFVAISVHEPEFFKFFFWHEHVSRYLSKSFEHQEPWYFYLTLLPLVFFPWSLFASPLKTVLKPKADEPGNPAFYLQAVIAGTLLFYSLSRSKLATYLVPVMPLGSILLGDAWVTWMGKKEAAVKLRKSDLLTFILAGLFILSASFVLVSPLFGLGFPRRIPEEVRFYLFLGLVLLIVESAVLIVCIARDRRKLLFYSLIVFLSLASVPLAFTTESVNKNYTTKHFAGILKPRLANGDKVFVYSQPGAFYDLAFYLDRPVKLVGLEGELALNAGDHEVEDAVVTPDEWKRLVRSQRVYSLMRKSDYDALEDAVKKHLTILAQDRRKVLLESRPS